MSTINYSKWNNIEVSDDEDDTHPNIDTPSLFRWRHQARLEREAKSAEDKAKFEKEYKAFLARQEDVTQQLNQAKLKNDPEAIARATKALEAVEVEEKGWHEKKSLLSKEERLRPQNVDTLCHEGKSKTVINKVKPKEEEALTEEQQVQRLQNFVKENDALIKRFGIFQRPDDTLNFLLEHQQLVCDETANKLVLWCIDLAVEEKFELMNHVSHQCIVMQFLLELAKSLKIDPRACIRPFFNKFRSPEPEYRRAFDEELTAFRERIRKRAKERVEEAVAELEAEEREKRLGPGGLDPVEVFETLPQELKECFEKKDMSLLQKAIGKLDYKDAKYHMNRCVASGLWVPAAGEGDDEAGGEADELEGEGEEVAGASTGKSTASTDPQATEAALAAEKREGDDGKIGKPGTYDLD